MQGIKKLAIPFVLIFFLSFLAINWSRVSWIFNYQAVLRYGSALISEKSQDTQIAATAQENGSSSSVGGIEIPRIGISAPLTFDSSLSDDQVYRSLDKGVVYYPSSVLPGKAGQTIILGHSAPVNWPKIKYDWVFTKLSELSSGDEIIIHYNNRQFKYKVARTVFLEKGGEVTTGDLTNKKNILVLISCWPPGKNLRRIAVEAEMI